MSEPPAPAPAFTLDEDAQAFADSLAAYCAKNEEKIDSAGDHPGDPWRQLAQLGLFEIVPETPAAGAGADSRVAEVVAAVSEKLGRALVRGPLAGTYASCLLLGADRSAALRSGAELVSFGSPPLMPWAPLATVFVEVESEGPSPSAGPSAEAFLARPAGAVADVETLAGDPWGRCDLERLESLGDARAALALADIALAAYLVGAGERLLTLTAAYAAQRSQFRHPIGDFQAVAYPLAESATKLAAAWTLAVLAARQADLAGLAAGAAAAATARLSATGAALDAAYRAHQTYGAMGFTVEGPVARVSHRIRQESLLAPGPAAARDLVLEGIGL